MAQGILRNEDAIKRSNERHPSKRINTASDVAKTAEFLLQNNNITGQIIHVDGGMSTLNDKIAIFWFRRDLRLYDNTGLNLALSESKDVQPIFIFDDDIIDELSKDDPRLNFIYQELLKINKELLSYNSSLKVYQEIH